MDRRTQDRIIILGMVSVPVFAILIIGVLALVRNSSIKKDAPFQLSFAPSVVRGKLYINADSIILRGQSGRSYSRNYLSDLPAVYLSYRDTEVRLGQFEYGWGGTCSYSGGIPPIHGERPSGEAEIIIRAPVKGMGMVEGRQSVDL